jgi:molecular chaperone IbpA
MHMDYAPFYRSAVGFENLIGMLEAAADNSQGYPPYNIERTAEDAYRISLAVAGFAEKDLTVEIIDGVLKVTGRREEIGGDRPAFLHQGIAGRPFERSFQLAEHVEVKNAKLEHGLLHVELERIVPEERKPRRIAINSPDFKTIEGGRAA